MLYSLEAVRDNIRNREGKRVFYLGKGDQLTSEARDYLCRERIDILPATLAKPDSYTLPGGGTLSQKPEHMTHLYGNTLVPKNHPRIRFRGKIDTLESELILCQLEGAYTGELRQILELVRRLIACDVLREPVGDTELCGLDAEDQRKHSHFPQEYYGQPHFMPEHTDGPVIARLNRARCAAREAELAGVDAFVDVDGVPTRPDILQALNRVSSMLYILMIRAKAGPERNVYGY
ncbi:MAG: ATP-binding protein [Ruminococcaceae bacterium]|nr:ATP-binding protein [Oscillospiraceae bacterium]